MRLSELVLVQALLWLADDSWRLSSIIESVETKRLRFCTGAALFRAAHQHPQWTGPTSFNYRSREHVHQQIYLAQPRTGREDVVRPLLRLGRAREVVGLEGLRVDDADDVTTPADYRGAQLGPHLQAEEMAWAVKGMNRLLKGDDAAAQQS